MKEFEQIYRQHATAVYRFSLKAVGQKPVAEEITQDCFLALRQDWTTVDREQLQERLFAIATRLSSDYWRREFREERRKLEYSIKPGHEAPEHSLLGLLRHCSPLKPLHRICVVLRFVHGCSRDEIAQRTNLNNTRVKAHLQYALRLLQEQIGEQIGQGQKNRASSAKEVSIHA